MADLVRKKDVIDLIKWVYTNKARCCDPLTDTMIYKTIPKYIENMGGIEPKEIGCGYWVKSENKDYWMCTCCEKETLLLFPSKTEDDMIRQNPHCRMCGAQMIKKR